MRVLLDESLPRRLSRLLVGHEVTTVPEQGWAGFGNGALLAEASQSFDAFITIDANLPYQQALERYSIGVIVLRARSNQLQDLEALVPAILSQLQELQPGELRKIGA